MSDAPAGTALVDADVAVYSEGASDWLLARPTVANIVIGARNGEQLKQNLGAVGWSLTEEQIARLERASHRPLAYPYWHQKGFDLRNPKPAAP